ncbi:MAG: NADPH-dependent F420 reductase [Methanocalculus sp.]|uniref:NADPH-dependent F420 reductase n=1 Tax=Methanocalculus sp. TaxID=2004547 RepID=UPI00271C9A1B|nr:NADPH-dependent F420 reductase [Methanocalculus sp.]MDO9538923.1 NADPH-dependent F420 reductase [Methanocalculus sp.]
MKIGIVGGTGEIGEGMALRLSHLHEVILGSRDEAKAYTASECTITTLKERGITSICRGVSNQEAVDAGDIIVLALPFAHLESTLSSLTGFEDKIVITPVNPIGRAGHFYYNPPEEGSAAIYIRERLPKSARIVSAFNNIAAHKWKDLDATLDYTVAVCSDDAEAKSIVMELIHDLPNLTPLDAGPLAVSSIVESVTPLLLNLAKLNGMRDVGVQFK